ncbi:HlyD family secretion protein [Microvirga massiliensis]|uniref:HlyD family secretion protein n=1 Tax=Microvirga massiliensis TaxID=1033741 RepID=UPI00062B8BCC|nr:HlyD family secretion protein [Microvirga massiliensis]
MAELRIVRPVDAGTGEAGADSGLALQPEEARSPGPAAPIASRQSRSSGKLGKRLGQFLIATTILAGCGALAGDWIVARWSHVYVNDSRIAGNIVTVSSQSVGTVTALPILAGDTVRKGDSLAAIDRRAAELKLQEIDAEIGRIDADQERLRAQQAMVRSQTQSRLDAARSRVASAEAGLRAREADLEQARSESERANSLHHRQIVSEQRFDEIRTSLVSAEQAVLQARAGVESAKADLRVVEADLAQVDLLERQIEVLNAQRSAQISRREQQRIDLEERKVSASFDGVIDAVFVDVGEYVTPGTRLFMYHDPHNVWVDANVKETDFARIKAGARAVVTVDAYPGHEFKGEVVRLGQAATSQFALLPSPNPSGNFTKVAQRLPVRISVEQQDDLLRPGMMVEVTIDAID